MPGSKCLLFYLKNAVKILPTLENTVGGGLLGFCLIDEDVAAQTSSNYKKTVLFTMDDSRNHGLYNDVMNVFIFR